VAFVKRGGAMGVETSCESSIDICVDRNVGIRMRDGTVLRADVYRPKQEGQYPVLVERVAYELGERCRPNGEFYASRGYVFVGQSVRGRFWSGGEFRPGHDDGWGANRDGYDTIEWAASQPWSSGRVGMLDGSYSGFTQYMVAPARPPHLTALFVREGLSDAYRDFWYWGGANRLGVRDWVMRHSLAPLRHESSPPGMEEARGRLEKAVGEMGSWYWHLPLKSVPPLESLAPWYFEVLEHPEDGPYWWPVSPSLKFGEVDVPILHLGGWYDVFLGSTLRCFCGIRAEGRSEQCRAGQRLVVGPWVHGPGNVGKRIVGDLDFGPQAELGLHELRLEWYDYWLKGAETGAIDGAPVRVFLMGDNRWLELEEWPPSEVEYRPMYFRQGPGNSAASLNDGGLSFGTPGADESPDSYGYDPQKPIMSSLEFGPKDRREFEGRMLTYTSEVLEEDLVVVGDIRAILHGLSSAPDTDWVVWLSDVWPDGRSVSVCSGVLRARYRDSFEFPELMVPGQIYQFTVDMSSTAQVFKAGHRVRVAVTSSEFPVIDRNLNTGGPFGEEVCGQVAINTVFHDVMRPSHILLPVVSQL
jgi:putative CocE/NonD family hydrolase